MWREKHIRLGWACVALNALVSLMQVGFTWGHWIKHEYWLMLVSGFFFLFNGYMAYWMWTKVKIMKEDYKQYVWRTLQTSSDVLKVLK